MNTATLPPLALIAGPTASGKSALALALAARTNGTIVNADSAQVYRDLRIVTARPSASDEARAAHRLFGHVDGTDTDYSAARWAAEARAAIGAIHAEGGLPILVGGTGLYLRTLLDGIAPVPAIDPAIRAEVRALPVVLAHAALAREDPVAAAKLAPRDSARIARALEVVRATGRPLGTWQHARAGGIGDAVALRAVVLLPDRAWLDARIARRFAAMVEDGAIDEVAALRTRRDIPGHAPIRRAIGVRELGAYLDGEALLTNATDAAILASRRYAKRQSTWFRHQPPPSWRRITESQSFNTDDTVETFFH